MNSQIFEYLRELSVLCGAPLLPLEDSMKNYSIDVSIVIEASEFPSPEEAAQAVIDSLKERIADGTVDGVIQVSEE